MISTTNKNTVITISGILIIIITLLYIFVISPKMKIIKSIGDDVQQQKIDLESKYQKGQSLKELYVNLDLVKANKEKILHTLIQQDEELEFITALEKTANDLAITQEVVLSPPDLESNSQKAQTLEIKISLVGNFIDIVKAIEKIEKMPYYIILNKLEFSGDKKTTTPVDLESGQTPHQNVRANLIGQIYWLPN